MHRTIKAVQLVSLSCALLQEPEPEHVEILRNTYVYGLAVLIKSRRNQKTFSIVKFFLAAAEYFFDYSKVPKEKRRGLGDELACYLRTRSMQKRHVLVLGVVCN
jgi:hypothetical protein